MHLPLVMTDHVVQIRSKVAHQPANAVKNWRELRGLEYYIELFIGLCQVLASFLRLPIIRSTLLVFHLLFRPRIINQ